MRAFVSIALALTGANAFGQWTDIKRVTTGGEPTVVTDGKGNVFIAGQQPCELHISRDWGATFTEKHTFAEGIGDMHLAAWGEGRVHLAYMVTGLTGIRNYYSFDGGKTMREGGKLEGQLDREWIAPNLRTGEVHMVYADGFIGGPKSKGIFTVQSGDYGRSFSKPVRIDKPIEGLFAVDPYLAITPNGKMYAAWGASKDYNRITGYHFASSSDGGKTWKGHTEIAEVKSDLGDTQERWMPGGLLSVGENRVIVYYHSYAEIEVDGQKHRPLLTWMRISDDGGASFSPATTVMPMEEIKAAVRTHTPTVAEGSPNPIYIQTLPWMAADADGNVHLALVDNRTGQTAIEGQVLNRWGVRYLQMEKGSKEFGPSEQVSQPFAAIRPPLDFISLAVDSKHVYIAWPENNNSISSGDFTGELYLGRKARS